MRPLGEVSRHFIDFKIVSHPPELLAIGDEGLAAEGLQLQGFAQVIVGMVLQLGPLRTKIIDHAQSIHSRLRQSLI